MNQSLIGRLLGLNNGDPTAFDFSTLEKFITVLREFFMVILAGYAIIGLIVGAYQYFTAYGNDEKAAKAKKTILWVVVGIALIIASNLILYEIGVLVDKNATKPPAIQIP